MEHSRPTNTGMMLMDLGERVAVLETEWAGVKTDVKEIKDKLDELLHLKSKGMGALSLVGILLSSGLLGIVAMIAGMFNHKVHL